MPSEFAKRQKDDMVRDISSLGSLFAYLLILIIFLIQKNYYLAEKLFAGIAIIYSVVIIVKSIYFKERPERYPYSSFIERLDASSFPSMHAIRISFLSAILIKYFDNYIMSIAAVILVLMVSYSRIYLKKHDKIDVLAGIFLGVAVYFAVNWVF